ncbi:MULTISPECIES: hypothetical protein [unclassified Nocardioides]|uniref:hypothetical protein n=1 Tax=unclassified Nocardioides TaxID=2615069 RepID=UPI0006FB3713|nr:MULTISPECIES: hypothetical protein [unclassified Nocardioides]KRA28053.1 hypothetical protein ASD81_23055 [Nocardioides sp. Root614]KRA86028.1 hypothetical protein ASD84_23295 [Nocardioides sp. Root682]
MKPFRLLAVVAVLVGLTAVLAAGWQAHRSAERAAARVDALSAARTRVPDLLSYDAGTLERDLDRALDQTTGDFADDYRKILADVVEPTAKSRGITTKASVSAAGVVSGGTDEVVVLVFLTQTTTATGDRSSVSGSRVEVAMERVDEVWKISGLEPV